jgi:putative transposase
VASRATYGYRRVHAELTQANGVFVSANLMNLLMHNAAITGLPEPGKTSRNAGVPTDDDLVNRCFNRDGLNELWVIDIAEHKTREGKIYCCAVLDKCSRKIVGWSIDSVQDSQLVVNALDMTIKRRKPRPGSVVHADHGVQFTSWAFTNKIRSAGLMPSFGSIGDTYDNAMMESFWSTMQIKLFNRKKWKRRIELANAIFEFIEVFYNRQRRYSKIGYISPIEFVVKMQQQPA